MNFDNQTDLLESPLPLPSGAQLMSQKVVAQFWHKKAIIRHASDKPQKAGSSMGKLSGKDDKIICYDWLRLAPLCAQPCLRLVRLIIAHRMNARHETGAF
jgi:hypothetical protein